MPLISRLVSAGTSFRSKGAAHSKELSNASTPTLSMGRRLSTTPRADCRASCIFLPSIDDDLSTTRTTAVPSGVRGGASIAGSMLCKASACASLGSRYRLRSPAINRKPPPSRTNPAKRSLTADGHASKSSLEHRIKSYSARRTEARAAEPFVRSISNPAA